MLHTRLATASRLIDRSLETIQDSTRLMKPLPRDFGTRKQTDELGKRAARPEALAADELHLWHVSASDGHEAALTARARQLLDADEWSRADRFRVPQGRLEQLAARCLVRTALSQYSTVEPDEWMFTEGPYGRPRIAAPPHAPVLHFNLSHSAGLVVCAVSAHHEVGVDVEHVDRRMPRAVAHAHFAPAERAALWALPDGEQPRRFVEYWTLKEAYVKARGAGLALPLDQFAFALHANRPPTIQFAQGFGDVESDWRFEHVRLGAHLVAVAARTGGGPVRLVMRGWTPDSGEVAPA